MSKFLEERCSVAYPEFSAALRRFSWEEYLPPLSNI